MESKEGAEQKKADEKKEGGDEKKLFQSFGQPAQFGGTPF